MGHILFSPVRIETADGIWRGMGLAPMAVVREFQGRGVGSALVRAGLTRLDHVDCPFCVVLGYPEYYPRFGFEPSSRHGVVCQWEEVPDGAFMIRFSPKGISRQPGGVAFYRDEFNGTV